MLISELNHAASASAVYASSSALPHSHARLASGWWLAFAGRVSNPLDPYKRFRSSTSDILLFRIYPGATECKLREEVTHTSDRGRLLTFARRWLYDHKLWVARDRDLRAVIAQPDGNMRRRWRERFMRRSVRSYSSAGSNSFAFRSRESLFIPADRWQQQRNHYYRRLSLPKDASAFLEPLIGA